MKLQFRIKNVEHSTKLLVYTKFQNFADGQRMYWCWGISSGLLCKYLCHLSALFSLLVSCILLGFLWYSYICVLSVRIIPLA